MGRPILLSVVLGLSGLLFLFFFFARRTDRAADPQLLAESGQRADAVAEAAVAGHRVGDDRLRHVRQPVHGVPGRVAHRRVGRMFGVARLRFRRPGLRRLPPAVEGRRGRGHRDGHPEHGHRHLRAAADAAAARGRHQHHRARRRGHGLAAAARPLLARQPLRPRRRSAAAGRRGETEPRRKDAHQIVTTLRLYQSCRRQNNKKKQPIPFGWTSAIDPVRVFDVGRVRS